MSKILKIGEFSQLCHVSIKTLRYYEEKGLLIPSEIDAATGYRLYRLNQTIRLSHILHLKSLGFSLTEIAQVLNQEDTQLTLDLVVQKLKQCDAEIAKLQTQKRQLESFIQLKKMQHPTHHPMIRTLPAHIAAQYRQVIKNYDELSTLCINTIGPEMMRLGCMCPEPQYSYIIIHNEDHQTGDLDVTYCEAVDKQHNNSKILQFIEIPAVERALCWHHLGPYTSLSHTLEKLIIYIETKGFVPTNSTRFCFIDGPWNKQNPEDYLTEIQIPIL